MIYILNCLFSSFALSEKQLLFNEKKPDQLKLPNYVGATKERFNEIMNTITKAKMMGQKLV